MTRFSSDSLPTALDERSVTPTSSSDDVHLSGSDTATILTPSSSGGTVSSRQAISDLHQIDQFSPVVKVEKFVPVDIGNGFGPDPCEFTNQMVPYGPQSQTDVLDIGNEVARLSNPDSPSSSIGFDVDFHRFLATPSPKAESYRFAHDTRSAGNKLQNIAPLLNVQEPCTYVSLCFLSCIHQGQRRPQEAKLAAVHAAQIFGVLIKQSHDEALACLDIVLTVLYYHGQIEFAVLLLEDAMKATLRHLERDNNLVMLIVFLISQATSTAKECEVTLRKLEDIYGDFVMERGLEHPYTLTAGYRLAWRLSLEGDGDSKADALRRLDGLQSSVDRVFGRRHMEAIGCLVTKSRVLQELERLNEAAKVMADAMTRINQVFPPFHPYSLETKSRQAHLLRCVDDELAEEQLIEVAIARMEVLGPENELSKESIGDVEETLCEDGRGQEYASFRSSLELAAKKRSTRDPVMDY